MNDCIRDVRSSICFLFILAVKEQTLSKIILSLIQTHLSDAHQWLPLYEKSFIAAFRVKNNHFLWEILTNPSLRTRNDGPCSIELELLTWRPHLSSGQRLISSRFLVQRRMGHFEPKRLNYFLQRECPSILHPQIMKYLHSSTINFVRRRRSWNNPQL